MATVSSAWSNSNWNKALNKYNDDKVKMSSDETKKAVQIVIRTVQDILKEVNRQDKRFDCQPLHAGSYAQGLKVEKADEFDVNAKLYIPGLSWDDLTAWKSRYYEFSDGPSKEDPATSFPESRTVVRPPGAAPALKRPLEGYCFVSIEKHSGNSPTTGPNGDIVFDGDIIPYLVKKRFKDLLAQAITTLNLRENGLVRKGRPHGPALTIRIKAPELSHIIDVDFAPVIDAGLPIPSRIKWPRSQSRWPSEDKKRKIQNIGINLVAKKNFYWMLSFGKMEKELMDGIDEGGGCRKQVHKLTKKMLNDFWCKTTKPVISSYHFKNVLFWECEKHPLASSWTNEHLYERFHGVVTRMRDAISARCLQLYFYPKVNLFLEKKVEELDLVGKNIDKFFTNPPKYLNK